LIQEIREDESRERPTCAGVPRSREEPSRGHRSRQMSCDKSRILHRVAAHRDNPRRAEPVGFPRRPARSVAADQVNVACCQATPWLASCGSPAGDAPESASSLPAHRGSAGARPSGIDRRFDRHPDTATQPDRSPKGPSREARRRRDARSRRSDERGQLEPFLRRGTTRRMGQHGRTGRAGAVCRFHPRRRGDRASATETGITPEGAPPLSRRIVDAGTWSAPLLSAVLRPEGRNTVGTSLRSRCRSTGDVGTREALRPDGLRHPSSEAARTQVSFGRSLGTAGIVRSVVDRCP
jgi:hypothetical protein